MKRMHHSRSAGFSLMELMLAMALFSLLSVSLVTLLSRATGLLAEGNSGVDTLDKLQLFSETFEKDAATIYTQRDSDEGIPDVRFYSDFADSRYDPEDDKAVVTVQRLMFVRMIPNEATSTLTRQAGSAIGEGAKEYLDQKDDTLESSEGRLRATGGQMAVMYTAIPESTDDPAVLTLFRAIRSPLGGDKSLLPTLRATDPSATVERRGPLHLKEVQEVADPLLKGVLYFGVEFWGRKTRVWDTNMRPPAGSSPTWDSTRGILDGSRGTAGFHLAKFGVGAESSLSDPVDDVFPRRMRVTLVVEELGRNARTGLLADDISADARSLELLSTSFIPTVEGARRFVKIGTEWIEFMGNDDGSLTNLKRGARGTTAQAHVADSVVHHGRTLVREFVIPTYRDTYQEDLSSNVRIR